MTHIFGACLILEAWKKKKRGRGGGERKKAMKKPVEMPGKPCFFTKKVRRCARRRRGFDRKEGGESPGRQKGKNLRKGERGKDAAPRKPPSDSLKPLGGERKKKNVIGCPVRCKAKMRTPKKKREEETVLMRPHHLRKGGQEPS